MSCIETLEQHYMLASRDRSTKQGRLTPCVLVSNTVISMFYEIIDHCPLLGWHMVCLATVHMSTKKCMDEGRMIVTITVSTWGLLPRLHNSINQSHLPSCTNQCRSYILVVSFPILSSPFLRDNPLLA